MTPPGAAAELTFEVPHDRSRLGPRMQMGPITAIQPDAPAAKAGLRSAT